ncbi:ATP-binding protein [Armatimonas sp.]|uniref:DNA polymerase III subunit n=1 Tax=Armatimonas sp. TaxID=1872638 RepID=UPI003751A4E6
MPFSEILGQETAIASLKAALERDAVPQVYLFVGPESVGKTTTALAFVRALFGNTPVHNKRIGENQHPDLTRIAPDGELTRIWQLWNRPGHPTGALENLSFAPINAPRRVYLIERAETLNEESANSLLKALEEPPRYIQFVLCAPSVTSVLPTVLSRCQVVRFSAVARTTIQKALTARGIADAATIAAYAEGAPGRAFRLAETDELKDQRGALLDLAHRIALSPPIAAFRLAEDLRKLSAPPKAKKGEEEPEEKSSRGDMGRALDVLATWYGDLLQLSLRGPDAPILHADRRTQAREAAAKYRPEQLAACLEALFKSRRHLARNANAQLATEALLMKLAPRT